MHTLPGGHTGIGVSGVVPVAAPSCSPVLSFFIVPSVSATALAETATAAFQSQGCFGGTTEIRCMYVKTGPTQWFATLAVQQSHLESF